MLAATTFKYFIDMQAFQNKLMLIKSDGSNEIIEHSDERFDFQGMRIAQIGDTLLTYANATDPVRVTKYT